MGARLLWAFYLPVLALENVGHLHSFYSLIFVSAMHLRSYTEQRIGTLLHWSGAVLQIRDVYPGSGS